MSALIDTLTLPFQFAFMRQAMLIAVIVAVPAALLSCFLVLKGWSLMGDAISHAILPGVVVAYIAGLTAPKGRTMGHAGAIISAFGESASEKVEILSAAGVTVAENPSVIGETIARKMAA